MLTIDTHMDIIWLNWHIHHTPLNKTNPLIGKSLGTMNYYPKKLLESCHISVKWYVTPIDENIENIYTTDKFHSMRHISVDIKFTP